MTSTIREAVDPIKAVRKALKYARSISPTAETTLLYDDSLARLDAIENVPANNGRSLMTEVLNLVEVCCNCLELSGNDDLKRRVTEFLSAEQPSTDRVSTQYAWVIESTNSSPSKPKYWRGMSTENEPEFWNYDHMEAMRFESRAHAEGYAKDKRLNDYRICEHGWAPTVNLNAIKNIVFRMIRDGGVGSNVTLASQIVDYVAGATVRETGDDALPANEVFRLTAENARLQNDLDNARSRLFTKTPPESVNNRLLCALDRIICAYKRGEDISALIEKADESIRDAAEVMTADGETNGN